MHTTSTGIHMGCAVVLCAWVCTNTTSVPCQQQSLWALMHATSVQPWVGPQGLRSTRRLLHVALRAAACTSHAGCPVAEPQTVLCPSTLTPV
eukprot:CAMPEP_0202857348 /NCGR_PEP_ID=MMETSP1391-20130828/327_1 /ASSEMBLY_ACC=CAM_ASM_000867 /TAXON_ID=1034604 /ORGANISM="Chlamydomonas leiostraca, Strain SAG 11-49" /LENGTH=91 /DNA_ID=CAMNT_0049536139 /DNA_START=320 /DNA_END=595 /DNA_ORIENTATION=-